MNGKPGRLTGPFSRVTLWSETCREGWTVFTREGEAITQLEPNGTGGFDRLAEIMTAAALVTALRRHIWTG